MYELLSGKPVFAFETATDAAFAHVATGARAAERQGAARLGCAKDVDQFVLALLAKDPARRPKDAAAVLDQLESLGRASSAMRAAQATFPEERLTEPGRPARRRAGRRRGGHRARGRHRAGRRPDEGRRGASTVAADGVDLNDEDAPRGQEVAPLPRGAHLRRRGQGQGAAPRRSTREIVELDPSDEIALIALDEVRKALGKHAEIVESLMARSEQEPPGRGARAHLRRDRTHLRDGARGPRSGDPRVRARALRGAVDARVRRRDRAPRGNQGAALERGARRRSPRGSRRRTCRRPSATPCSATPAAGTSRSSGAPDMGLHAYQQILTTDPASEEAYEGLTSIYRKAQQWPELVAVLVARADASGSSPRARDLRAEAAELFEQKLNDGGRAKEIFAQVLAEDPGHLKASDGHGAHRRADGRLQVARRHPRAPRGVAPRTREGRRAAAGGRGLRGPPRGSGRGDAPLRGRARHRAARSRRPSRASTASSTARASTASCSTTSSGRWRSPRRRGRRSTSTSAWPRFTTRSSSITSARPSASRAMLAFDAAERSGADDAPAPLPRARSLGEARQALREARDGDGRRRAPGRADDAARTRPGREHRLAGPRDARLRAGARDAVPGHAGALEALARLRELTGDAHAALSAIEALAGQGERRPRRRPSSGCARRACSKGAGIATARSSATSSRSRRTPRTRRRRRRSGRRTRRGAMRRAWSRSSRRSSSTPRARWPRRASTPSSRGCSARSCATTTRPRRTRGRRPTSTRRNAEALLVLGDLAFEGQRYLEATKHLESLVGRAQALPKEDAVRAIVRYVEAYGRSVSARAFAARHLDPGRARVGSAVVDHQRPPAPRGRGRGAGAHRAGRRRGPRARRARDVRGGRRPGSVRDVPAPPRAARRGSLPRRPGRRRVAARRVVPAPGRARQGGRLPPRGGGLRPRRAPSRCRRWRASTSRRATGRSSSGPSAAASRSRSAPSGSTSCSRSATPSSRS